MSVRFSLNDVVVVYVRDYGGKEGIGLIKYIGSVRDSSESFVGLELIEPIAEGHDGIIDGHRYFECKSLHGIHVPLPNIINKLESAEVMVKLQEVIAMFKHKLNEYMHAVHERNVYIKDLELQSTSKQQPQHGTTTPYTTKSMDDSGTPSSTTPAPQSIRTKHPKLSSNGSGDTMVQQTGTADDRTRNELTPAPEAETVVTEQRRVRSHSPSQPHLNPRHSHVSQQTRTVSPHSPNTPYGATYLMPEYPEYLDDNDDATSSYLSPHSSAYTTPQSTVQLSKLNSNSNARNLMAKYYANRHSNTKHKHARRSGSHHTNTNTNSTRKSDSMRTESKRRSASSAAAQAQLKKDHRLRQRSTSSLLQPKPHITGSETPAFNADNDAVLSLSFEDVNQKKKRRKSKELLIADGNEEEEKEPVHRIQIPTSARPTRSVSAEFTPSQMQRTYTFHTIEEEPDDVTPRFQTFHSTPVFTAQSHQNPYQQHAQHQPYASADTLETMEDDEEHAATPDLPPQTSPYVMYQQQPYRLSADNLHAHVNSNMHAQLQQQQPPHQQQRASLPLAPTQKTLISRSRGHEIHRSSLPGFAGVDIPGRHMSRSSQMDIQLPHFSSQSNTMPTHNPSIPQFNSLRDIHEQQRAAAQMHRVPQAPQLDHWIAQPPTHMMSMPMTAVHEPRPPMKAKSMPSPGHFPSQQSLDMNPYIDQQYIFQPQYAAPNTGMEEQYTMPPSHSSSPMHHSQPHPNSYSYSPIMHSPIMHSPMQHPISVSSSHHNSPHAVAVAMPVPMPMPMQSYANIMQPPTYEYNQDEITKMINAQMPQSKIGRVEYAPRRKSLSNQLPAPLKPRRKSSVTKPPYPEPRMSTSKSNKSSSIHLQQQHAKKRQHHHNPKAHRVEMDGFEITDAMYD